MVDIMAKPTRWRDLHKRQSVIRREYEHDLPKEVLIVWSFPMRQSIFPGR